MKRYLHTPHNGILEEDATPVCRQDFCDNCDNCGDCLACADPDEECSYSKDGHTWVVYTEDDLK